MTAAFSGPAPGGDPAPVRLPDPKLLFDARAERLRALAAAHSAPEWLLLLSRVARGQALAVRELPVPPVRAPGGGPPLAVDRLPRDGTWRRMLAVILSAARAPGLPPETEEALRRVGDADAGALEALADAIVAGAVPRDLVGAAPFVGAALQAWLSALAAGLDPRALGHGEGSCPACGGPPVAAVMQGGDRFRYVSCAFCAAEWHVPRVRCVLCAGEQLEYLHAEGDRGAKAEACRTCGAYLKVLDGEARPGADGAADDAATIALDLRVADEGYHRAGPNLYVAVGLAQE